MRLATNRRAPRSKKQMRNRYIPIILAFLVLPSFCFADDKGEKLKPAQPIEEVRQQLEKVLKNTQTPGMSVAIVLRGTTSTFVNTPRKHPPAWGCARGWITTTTRVLPAGLPARAWPTAIPGHRSRLTSSKSLRTSAYPWMLRYALGVAEAEGMAFGER